MSENMITAIERQKKSDDRCSVFIDGQFAFGISDIDLYNLKLKVGDIITDEKQMIIDETISVDKCKNYALGLVSSKMYTKKELTEKMNKKGYSQTAISGVMSILEEYGYVNDEEFAKMYSEELAHKYGTYKIKFNLKQKGIPENIISSVCENIDNDDDLMNMIKLKTRGKVLDRELCSKLIRQFMAKGFSYESVKDCISKLTEEAEFLE